MTDTRQEESGYRVDDGFLTGPRVCGADDGDEGSMYLCQVVRCAECGAYASVEDPDEPCGCEGAPWVVFSAVRVESKDGARVFWDEDTAAERRGYERGIREAAAVIEEIASECVREQWVRREVLQQAARYVRALLDDGQQPGEEG